METSLVTAADEPIVRLVPTIKGIFVNSHVERVRRLLGPGGVEELERRFGKPLHFRPGQDVPISEEVRLIELAFDLLRGSAYTEQKRAFEAGRLHFENFSTTAYFRILVTLFPRNFRFMLLHAKTVAERVFKGVRFDVSDLGATRIRLTMENVDYPLQHFQGFLAAWMESFGLRGKVVAKDVGHRTYEYELEWAA